VNPQSKAGVQYFHLAEPSFAKESELPDSIILRCAGEELIGMTILQGSKRD
jgi:hypothetical protein